MLVLIEEKHNPVISGELGKLIIYFVCPPGVNTWIIPVSLKVPNSNLATYNKSEVDTVHANGPNLPLNVLNTLE